MQLIITAVLLLSITSCTTSKKTIVKQNKYKSATEVVDEILTYNSNSNVATENIKKIFKLDKKDNKALYSEVSKWLGAPYKFGGSSISGTDCSGMVMQVYKKVYSIVLERNSAMMYEKNCRNISKKNLSEGDLVFFSTTKTKSKINHVGIYLKDGYFVHASSSKGVIISSLNETYYTRAYIASGRVKGRD
ncbi:MAG: C40 family peptidase [Muribaculaceae bacterium]|nr:C40 family peptidase [Muribaculaceae bacterium]